MSVPVAAVAVAGVAPVVGACLWVGASLLVCVLVAVAYAAAVATAVRAATRRQGATAAEAAEATRTPWDYIIVGGGTAGCVLANRLSAGGNGKRVLLLEAGSSEFNAKLIQIPAGVLRLFQGKFDWHFMSANETATSGRAIYLPRGKVLGGSSALNVLLYHRGDAQDYDLWETEFGCTGWKAEDVLPYFKRTQDDQTGLAAKDPKHHSTGGEWSVDHVRYQNPLSKCFLKACEEAGLPRNDDFNNWDRPQVGAGRFLVSQRDGTRCSAASAMLSPAAKDPKRQLRVLDGAPAHKIVFGEDRRAIGVQFVAGGVTHVARLATQGGEVILAGGVLHSPQLLMLSGVGPREHLTKHGIDVVSDVPAVGENLQDHPAAVVSYECPPEKRGISVTSLLRITGSTLPHPWPMLQWLLFRSGPLTSTGCDHGGFFRTPAAPKESSSADLQMRFLAARAVTADGMGTFTSFKKTANHPDGFSFQSIAIRPQSRGRVLLASADPEAKPVVEGNYLVEKQDVATVREGLRLARKIAQQPAFKEYLGPEVFPGPDVKSDAALDAYIADSVHTANALVGTCRMGKASDPKSVVDAEMRVKGVAGLRVCDASVMPKLPGGQSGAPAVMIAEKAADMILGQ